MDKDLQIVKTSTFEDCRFDCYQDGAGEFWGTREQIGAMLGYADPNQAITNIHARNKDRLNKFSTTLKMRGVEGGREVEREVTVYNFKGLLEICRYSNQPKANAVMDFLWDVADEIRRTGAYKGKGPEALGTPNTLYFFYNGHKTRIVIAESRPWVVAKDIAETLGYSEGGHIATIFRQVPKRCRRHLPIHTSNAPQTAVCFSEEGGRIAISHSTKAGAPLYLQWLNSEVFPTVKGENPKKLKASAGSAEQQTKDTAALEKIRLLQRMIEKPAYKLTPETKRKLVKQIISLMA